jgi:hypothetical protein
MSVWHIPVATTLTSTSYGRQSSSDNFSTSNGPPFWRTTAPVISFIRVLFERCVRRLLMAIFNE